MLNYTNELALPNISNLAKYAEKEVRYWGFGGERGGRAVCHEDLSQQEERRKKRSVAFQVLTVLQDF